jgi:hypothetical protein
MPCDCRSRVRGKYHPNRVSGLHFVWDSFNPDFSMYPMGQLRTLTYSTTHVNCLPSRIPCLVRDGIPPIHVRFDISICLWIEMLVCKYHADASYLYDNTVLRNCNLPGPRLDLKADSYGCLDRPVLSEGNRGAAQDVSESLLRHYPLRRPYGFQPFMDLLSGQRPFLPRCSRGGLHTGSSTSERQ